MYLNFDKIAEIAKKLEVNMQQIRINFLIVMPLFDKIKNPFLWPIFANFEIIFIIK